MHTRNQGKRRLVVESVALGLGYSCVLVWIGSAFVGSFGDFNDAYPYWPAIPHLRTDTAGFLAFAVAIVSLVVSRYLQLARRNGAPAQTVPVVRPPGVLALQAVADVALLLGTALVIYLSVNEAMHPWTMPIQLSHLLPWPSEGTVRVITLGICLVAVAVRRYLRATATRPSEAAPVPGEAASPRTRADADGFPGDASMHRRPLGSR